MNDSSGRIRRHESDSNAADRLMFGEDVSSTSNEDIGHWIGAYTELLAFKDRLLIDMEKGIESLFRPAEHEIREIDVTLILQQREGYMRRLEFWRQRQGEMDWDWNRATLS